MESIEELLEGRRRALVEGQAAFGRKVEADQAARVAGEQWSKAWGGMLAAGFSEAELGRVGMKAPGGSVVKARRKPRKVGVSAELPESSGRRAASVVPDGQEDGWPEGEFNEWGPHGMRPSD